MRNKIDIRMLIEKSLCIECRLTKGCFRFRCPLCGRFDSAVNPKTNLARCFTCEKNFNTIDLVMLIRQTDFVHSVTFLQSILQKNGLDPKPDVHQIISGSNPKGSGCSKHKPHSEKSDERPYHIKKILGGVLPDDDNLPGKPTVALDNIDGDRITKLEKQLEKMSRQIQTLTQAIATVLPSK